MLRTIVLLGAGAALGAVAAHWWVASDGDRFSAASGGTSFLTELGGALGLDRAPQPPRTESRLEAYRVAAGVDDAAALEAALAAAAARPESPARTLEIDALLLRLAELDARRAVRAARSLRLGDRFVAAVMAAWVSDDANAALAELGTLEPAGAQQASALAMLAALGASTDDAQRIMDALPAARRAAFELAAAGVRAERDLLGAFRDTQAISDDALRREALQIVARAWAKVDPAGALAQVTSLTQNDQTLFRSAVMQEWASLDPDAVFTYLESIDVRELSASTFVQHLAAVDPERLLAIAERVPGAAGVVNTFQLLAIGAVARSRPRMMSQRVAAMPPGELREQVVQAVTNGLAREDPDAAVAWVRSLDPPSRSASMILIQSIAQVDLDRALALTTELGAGVEGDLLVDLAFAAAFSNLAGEEKIAATAEKLAARNDLAGRRALGAVVQQWASRDHDAAFAWAVAHADGIGPDAFGSIANRIASRDAQAAAAYLDRVPAAHRGAWAEQTADAYARYDLPGAIGWLATLRGDPVYDLAFERVLTRAARSDVRAAARLLEDAPPSANTTRNVSQVASQWARQDPLTAAEWALRRGDAEQRSAAIRAVASAWVQRDPDATAAWARRVPPDVRDAVVQDVLAGTAAAGRVDMDLFSELSSDSVRQSVAQRIVLPLAARDVAQARAVADAFITDPRQRQLAEDQISRLQALPGL